MSDDWDVDSYKCEFENDEQWLLRKTFMLTYKDKFPEDEVVCLAQAFTNIEFMGCRYPAKLMVRIAELARGVVEQFQDKRGNSVKRTFVQASNAANAKVKGQATTKGELVSASEDIIIEQADKSTKSNESTTGYEVVKTSDINQNYQVEVSNTKESKSPDSEKNPENPKSSLEKFVLVLGPTNEHPINILQRSTSFNKCKMRWDSKKSDSSCTCRLLFNNECIATGSGETMKISKECAAMFAVAKLRESCYGIREKSDFFAPNTVTPDQIGSVRVLSEYAQLGEDNIGRKMMKLMGWKGGGLGSREQGRKKPITPSQLQVKRGGLGVSKTKNNEIEFKKKARSYICAWLKSNSNRDLVLSTDFSGEERKIMHSIAKSLSLKSKSYGKDTNRRLVISKKCDPWDIVQDLLRNSGSSEKYELLFPTAT